MASAADAVAAGHSLLVLHALANGAEVEALRSEASAAAFLSRRRSSMMKQALLDDVPEEAVEPTQVRMPIDQMLGEESQGLCDRLLLRLLTQHLVDGHAHLCGLDRLFRHVV